MSTEAQVINPSVESDLQAPRTPFVELMALALPGIAQMASYTVMQFIDRWMLAEVSDLHATAAGTAGITFFCFLGFGFGLLFVVNTLVSQSFGRGDVKTTGSVLWQGLWFSAIFGAVVLLLIPVAKPLFASMKHEARVVELEAVFMQVIAVTGWAKLATMAMSQFLLGLQRPTIVFVATLVGVGFNALFNWVLIFGHWGFAPMGVVGSAWGYNAGVMCEVLVMGAFIFRPRFVREHGIGDWKLRWERFRTLLKVGLPAGAQFICDIGAWTVFMNVIVGSFGTAALAANSFAFTYMHLCFMPAFGVGGAVTALVGKYIGMGKPDVSAKRAHLGFAICAAYMVIAGALLTIFRFQLIGLFSSDPDVKSVGATILLFVGMYQLFDAMFVIYSGALRGAGDTLVPAVVQIVLVWSIVVGGGAYMAHYAPQFGVAGPWVLATIFGGILGLFLLTRFIAGKWKQIRLDLPSDTDASNMSQTSARLADLATTELSRS